MGLIIKNGIKYFGDNTVELTQAQYDALSQEEKLNGTTYYITDGQNITTASAVTYDNTNSGLSADNVQEAIDEVKNDLSNCIHTLDVNIGGTNINKPDTGWYYAEVPFTLPTGAIQLGMFVNGGYDASVIPVLGYKKILLLCPTQRTVPSNNRVIRVIYFLP